MRELEMGTKSDYIAKINKIPTISFNKEQKEIAKKIIENTDEKDLDAVYGLITQRVKTGFVFDEAPEVNHNCVALVKEDKKLNITGDGLEPVEHKLIIGENYDALKNLCATYIDKSGKGLIDVIYIDPPYNTEATKNDGNDYKEEIEATKFIYRDKFTRDGWLNMMNERLKLAKRLLSDEGVIFISIDDTEQAYLKVLCDGIFGEKNFVTTIHCQLSTTQGMKVKAAQEGNIVKNAEYILCYSKDGHKNIAKYQLLYDLRPEYDEHYSLMIQKNGKITQLSEFYDYKFPKDCTNKQPMSLAEAYRKSDEFADIVRSHLADIVCSDKVTGFDISEGLQQGFYKEVERSGKKYLLTLDKNGNIRQLLRLQDSWGITDGFYKQEGLRKIRGDWWDGFYIDMGNVSKEGGVEFKNGKKPVRLIKQLTKMATKKNSIILDFFAGSGTTGQAVMELNEEDGGKRQFILVTNNENNIGTDITRERLYRVIKGKGSKGEQLSWQYSKEKPYLSSNNVTVFKIDHTALTLKDLEKAEKIRDIAKAEFKKLNPNCSLNNDFNVYNELAALNPQKGEK